MGKAAPIGDAASVLDCAFKRRYRNMASALELARATAKAE